MTKMTNSTPRVHLVQMDIRWEDRAANCRRVRELLTRMTELTGLAENTGHGAATPSHHPKLPETQAVAHAAETAEHAAGSGSVVAPGDLVVLPEMFDSGFSFNIERTNDANSATLRFLQDLARELRCTIQGSRTVVGDAGRGLNRATIVGEQGQVLCEYDKIHLFSPGREPERFAPGNRVATYAWNGMTVCPAICYDLRFPELFRAGLKMGAEMFVIGANWPTPREHHRVALSIARAIENQAFVVSVNRCGKDPNLSYAGGSLVVGPKGDVIARADNSECVLSVEVDAAAVARWRSEFSAWRDGVL